MKAHTVEWSAPVHAATPTRDWRAVPLGRALNLAARFSMVLAGALALLVGATWMSATPSMAPYLQALQWSAGFVFLALAVEAGGPRVALLLTATGIALPILAWLASRVAPEFAVLGATLVAAWVLAVGLRGSSALSA